MGDKVKVSVLEVNGVEELEGPREYPLTADIVELNPPVDGFDDVDAWVRNGPSSTDQHAGWEHILENEVVTVAERKQMVVVGELLNEGEIINCGHVIVL